MDSPPAAARASRREELIDKAARLLRMATGRKQLRLWVRAFDSGELKLGTSRGRGQKCGNGKVFRLSSLFWNTL